MLSIKKSIEFIVFSNTWIAFLAAGLTFSTSLLNAVTVSYIICLLVFFSTFSIYNFQRLVKHYFNKENISNRHLWINNNAAIIAVFVFLSSVGTVVLFFSIFSIQEFFILFPFALISGLYAVTLFSQKRALRDLPFLKIFLIAITWTVTTVGVPVLEAKLTLSTSLIGQFSFVFFYIISLTIPFDIRDINWDSDATKTIPQVVGKQNAIYISYGVLLLCGIVNYFSFFSWHYLAILFFTGILISFSNKKMPELYYSGILDGIMILFPLVNLF